MPEVHFGQTLVRRIPPFPRLYPACDHRMDFLLYLAMIPAIAMAAQWLAWRFNLPGILLLLLFGITLGLFVRPDNYIAELTDGSPKSVSEILFPIVSLSVAVIMFEGGLSLKLGELRESGGAALRLCTLGALITFLGASAAAHLCFQFPWPIACLLGAILVVTGPTVIGPLLRQVRPTRRVANALKWEGIVIDPIGAILAVLVFEQLAIQGHDASLSSAALMLGKTAVIGTVLGIGGGLVASTGMRRFWVPDNLHGVGSLAIGLLLFAISNHFAHESGLITVTVMGIWMTNQRLLDIEHVIEFHENLRTLLIGCLFVVLGSRVDLASTRELLIPAFGFVALLVLLVRPISVMVSLIGSNLRWNEQAFVASLAPRGIVAAAVSSIFALELETSGSAMASATAGQLSTITFLVIVASVAIYGLSAKPMARILGLADDRSDGVLIVSADDWVRDFALVLHKAGVPVVLVDTNYNKVSRARVAGLEAKCVNMLNEHAREDVPTTGIGRLMTMTANDEVNSLIVRECRTMFGRVGVYQLTFNENNSSSRRGMTENLMGRALFADGMTFSKIREMHSMGASFKQTLLSDEFGFEDFESRYPGANTLLALINEDNELHIQTVEKPLSPVAGDRIIAFVSAVTVPDRITEA